MRQGAKADKRRSAGTWPRQPVLSQWSNTSTAHWRALAVSVYLLTGAYKFLWKQNLTNLYHRGVQVCFLFYNKPYDQNQLKTGRASTLHFRDHSTTKESRSRDSGSGHGRMLLCHGLLSLLSNIPQDHPEWEWAR